MFVKLKDTFLNAGLDSAESAFDRHVISIYNVINCILLVCAHLLILNEIVRKNPKGATIAIGFSLALLFINWLNQRGYFSNVMFLDFYFANFVLCLVMFIGNRKIRVVMAILYAAYYITIRNFQANQQPLLGFEFDKISNFSLLGVFILLFWVLSYLLMIRLKESYLAKENLLSNLQSKTSELEEANKELARLNALASHDLKSPLRTISSYAGLIKKKNTDDNLNPYLDVIGDSSRHMINLIDQTISYNKLEGQGKEAEEIDLNELVDKVCSQLGDNFGAYELQRENLTFVHSQKMSIYQIIQNIIENGLKYNDSDKKMITISQEADDQNIYLKISDNGIGIDKEYHTKVFGMYERLHSSSTYEVTGLGLAICKKAINKLGGDIVLNSKPGEGSTFTVILPIIADVVKKEMPERSQRAVKPSHLVKCPTQKRFDLQA